MNTEKTAYELADPMMGTVANEVEGAGGGKTYPGAVVPFGMVQVSPDTVTGGDNGAGYSYGHPTIEGFSFTHLSGIGWYGDFGNIETMPLSGKPRYYSGTNEYTKSRIGERGWESRFDHETECAHPGYYAVTLTDDGIRCEATAAQHTGALRFTFSQGGESHVLIDLYRRVGGHSDEQELTVVSDREIRGRILCTPAGGGFGRGDGNVRYELFFTARFSRPMTGWTVRENGTLYPSVPAMKGNDLCFCADFDLAPGESVELHTGISFVDPAGAENNFRTEDAPFDVLRAAAKEQWEKALSLISVSGGEERDRTVFYSALYHTLLDPRDFSDCDGRCRADFHEITTNGEYVFRTVFSGWDVFRSEFPLLTLIRPDVVRDEINSLTAISEMNDEAPFARWELAGIETGCMVGEPGVNILADAYVKGIGGFDAEKAYAICRRHWLGDRSRTGETALFHKLGYFPGDISKTVEYSFTAWCLSRLAEALGHPEDARVFFERSRNYRNSFDHSAGWMNRRREDGTFEPFESKYDERGCIESNIYQQTWFVPHDAAGLVSLMGRERFEKELDEFFEKADLTAYWNDDYNHSNEPVHTVPQLYVHIGRADKAQYWIRRIQKEAYRPGPYGYCGNEDVGQLSAWFVLTAMGIHQSALSGNLFELNTPLFREITLRLDPAFHSCRIADTLTVNCIGDPAEYGYVAGVSLNGAPLDRAYLTWEELSAGGRVTFTLSAVPTDFGAENPPKLPGTK